MATKLTLASTKTEEREMVFTRVFDAPREIVFQMWTDPEHLKEWWGPRGCTNTIHEMDVRPGGVCRLTTSGPDGVDSPTKIVYREVTQPERLVYDHGDAGEPGNSRVTVTFAEEGRRTRVTLRILFPSAAARDTMTTKYHASEVVNQSLDRVGQRLAETLAGSPIAGDLVITRVFDAPRETMFKAWTEVERLKRWWGPKNFTNPVCEMDARRGGAIRIHMRAPDGACKANLLSR